MINLECLLCIDMSASSETCNESKADFEKGNHRCMNSEG